MKTSHSVEVFYHATQKVNCFSSINLEEHISMREMRRFNQVSKVDVFFNIYNGDFLTEA